MTSPSSGEVTQLLQAWCDGDGRALEELIPLVYKELHRAAQRYMARQAPDHTLQTTALVHEAYLHLVNLREPNWQNRAHFFAVCAKVMRRILIDSARKSHNLKRGGEAPHVEIGQALTLSREAPSDLVALDGALQSLAVLDPRKSRVVELRFFGGLSAKETAAVLQVSEETVLRDWRLAKMWLLNDLAGKRQNGA